MARRSNGRSSIDPAFAVKTSDLMREYATWQKKLFERFAEPLAKTSKSKKAKEAVRNAKGKWMVYSSEGIRCYHRIAKKSMDLYEELACLRNGAQYVATAEAKLLEIAAKTVAAAALAAAGQPPTKKKKRRKRAA